MVLAITDGRLDLGPWEQVFYAEFDGRRRKRVLLKAIGTRRVWGGPTAQIGFVKPSYYEPPLHARPR